MHTYVWIHTLVHVTLKLRLTLDVLYHSAHDFLIVGLCCPCSSWIDCPVNPWLRLQTCVIVAGSYPWLLGTKVISLYSCSKPPLKSFQPKLKNISDIRSVRWLSGQRCLLPGLPIYDHMWCWQDKGVKDVSVELLRGLVASPFNLTSHLGSLVLDQKKKAVDSMWCTSWERLKYFPVSQLIS